jgi:hypothetical protein
VVLEAKEYLSTQGHQVSVLISSSYQLFIIAFQVVVWSPPDPHLAFWYSVVAINGDGGKATQQELYEVHQMLIMPNVPLMVLLSRLNDELSNNVLLYYQIPPLFRRLIARVLKRHVGILILHGFESLFFLFFNSQGSLVQRYAAT